MCIVIDTNALPSVFKKTSSNHNEFAPVLSWIINGNGYLVYGGTKYKKELKEMGRYQRIVIELKKTRKACEVSDKNVDNKEKEIIKMTAGENFNDQHIISILCVSGCILLCSLDSSSYKYVKDTRFYSCKKNRPKIYRSRKHKNLLASKNIVKLKHTN